MTHFKALIFDMDGVITDSVELHYRAWKRLTDELGVPFERAVNETLRGLSRRDSLDIIFHGQALGEKDAQALMDRKNGYFLELVADITPADVLPGVREFIAQGRALGLSIALGSASQNAHTVLQKLGMLDAFDVIGHGNSVTRTKPAPDIFLWVAEQLKVAPCDALVIEDGAAGIEAALTGGFYTLGVGHSDVNRAHITLPTLAGADLLNILNNL